MPKCCLSCVFRKLAIGSKPAAISHWSTSPTARSQHHNLPALTNLCRASQATGHLATLQHGTRHLLCTTTIAIGAAASMQHSASATLVAGSPLLLPLRGQQLRRQHARQLTRCEVAKPGGGAREDELAQSSSAAGASDAPNGEPRISSRALQDVARVSGPPALLPATSPLPPARSCRRCR